VGDITETLVGVGLCDIASYVPARVGAKKFDSPTGMFSMTTAPIVRARTYVLSCSINCVPSSTLTNVHFKTCYPFAVLLYMNLCSTTCVLYKHTSHITVKGPSKALEKSYAESCIS
jgi:hypothetical protein